MHYVSLSKESPGKLYLLEPVWLLFPPINEAVWVGGASLMSYQFYLYNLLIYVIFKTPKADFCSRPLHSSKHLLVFSGRFAGYLLAEFCRSRRRLSVFWLPLARLWSLSNKHIKLPYNCSNPATLFRKTSGLQTRPFAFLLSYSQYSKPAAARRVTRLLLFPPTNEGFEHKNIRVEGARANTSRLPMLCRINFT